MGCPPLAIAYSSDLDVLARVNRESSRITNADPRCLYGCVVPNHTIAGYLRGSEHPLDATLDALPPDASNELLDAFEPMAKGLSPESFSTSGYVVHTLQTALQDATRADDVESAIVTAVNRGDDTDTIGAATGRRGRGQIRHM